MTTYNDVIEECRNYLMTSQPDRINVLDVGITAIANTLVMRHPNKGVSEGSRIVIDLEEIHVVEVATTGSTSTLTVIRGIGGSIGAVHDADDIIYINPQFSTFRISKAINQGLDNLSAEGLFQMRSAVLQTNLITLGYEVTGTTDFIDVWRVKFDTVGTLNNWPVLRPDQYWVDIGANVTDFPSGVALFLRESVAHSPQSLQIDYRSGFAHLVATGDDILTTTGLHTEAHDLPALYGAIRLLAGREVKRSFLNQQPEPRRQEEVPAGAANQSMRPLLEIYFDRIDKEIIRLKRKYPRSV